MKPKKNPLQTLLGLQGIFFIDMGIAICNPSIDTLCDLP